MLHRLAAPFALGIALLLAACGQEAEEAVVAPPSDKPTIYDEAEAFYASQPEFFRFKTIADLPADLEWENGMDLPVFASPDAKKGGTEYRAIDDFPRTLRHIGPDSNGSFRGNLLDNISVGLAEKHPNVEGHFPGTAREWAISKDDHTVYVRLDPDARWSDGTPVTADDFVFMFFFYQTDYITAPWYQRWYSTQYANITKYDDLTFSIQTAEARPFFEDRVLGLNGVPRHFYAELGPDFVERYQWRFVPTTGAYTLADEDLKKGRSIVMRRLENWWAKDKRFFAGRFNPDSLRFTVIRDPGKRLEAFTSGELDMHGLTLAELWYEKVPDDHPAVAAGHIHKTIFYNEKPRPNWGFWINTAKPLLDNRDIRIGIAHAIDWELVLEGYFRGDAERMRTRSDGYGRFTHPTLEPRRFSIDKALEAFARAGFSERGPDGILVNAEGARLGFSLSTGYDRFQDMLTILKQEAAKAGLEIRLEILEGTSAFKKVQEKNHEIAFTAFGIGTEPYPRYWDWFHSANAYDVAFLEDGSVNPDRKLKPQTNNLSSVAIRELDTLIEAYDTSEDLEEMRTLAFQMEELLHDNADFVTGFVIPLYKIGYWRWVRWPEDFNVKRSGGPLEYAIHWIDPDMKKETLAARRSGETFDPQILTFDQYKP